MVTWQRERNKYKTFASKIDSLTDRGWVKTKAKISAYLTIRMAITILYLGSYLKQKTKNKTSLVAQTVKCLPTMRKTWVRSLGREGPLEKEIATHSSIHAWKIPWTEEPVGLQSWTRLSDFTFTFEFI